MRDTSWQDEYVKVVKEVSGIDTKFSPWGGGWWNLVSPGQSKPVRKSQVIEWTETLRKRKSTETTPT